MQTGLNLVPFWSVPYCSLDGGNRRIIRARIAEADYRMVINPDLALTAKIQYMRDQYFQIPVAEGIIYSFKGSSQFLVRQVAQIKSYPGKLIMHILDNASLHQATKLKGYYPQTQTIVDTNGICIERTRI